MAAKTQDKTDVIGGFKLEKVVEFNCTYNQIRQTKFTFKFRERFTRMPDSSYPPAPKTLACFSDPLFSR